MQRWPLGEEIRYDGTPHPLVVALPHYHLVPKDPLGHMKWRLEVRQKCKTSASWRRRMLDMCAEDVLFFINTFVWINEPREGETDEYGNEIYGKLPFNTWCHQDPVIAAIDAYFGRRHIVEKKARAQGASWKVLAKYAHAWRFRKLCNLGMASETMQKADDPKRQGSLGYKFDFILRNLPPWMLPRGFEWDTHRLTTSHSWTNPENGAALYAESATENLGRSDRFTSFFLDEAGFFPNGYDRKAVVNLLQTTNQILLISSSNDTETEHYRRCEAPGEWLTTVLAWWDNPVHRRGLYRGSRGKIEFMDPAHKYPENYRFIDDGRLRSEWYDKKWLEADNPLLVARELDMDFGGATGKPFDPSTIERYKKRCMEPMVRGDLIVSDPANLKESEFVDNERGYVKLWIPLLNGRPPRGRYVFGCDISAGTGGSSSSNSVAIIFDAATGRQVGEAVRNDLPPVQFANFVAALCYWFAWDGGLPLLNWERNGIGSGFTQQIVDEVKYGNMAMQGASEEFRRFAKTTDLPGYHNSNTLETMRPLIVAMENDRIEILSLSLVLECGEYQFVEGNRSKIEHPKSRSGFDASEQGENHGDRAIAASLAVRSMNARPVAKAEQSKWDQLSKAPDGSIGRRIHDAAMAKGDPISCEW